MRRPLPFLGNIALEGQWLTAWRRAVGAHSVGLAVAIAGLCVGPVPAIAAMMQPATITLTPAATRLGYTVFALGIVPVTANFTAFSGTLNIDPAHPASCDVQVTVQVASLQMDNPERNRLALGETMLDARHYPTMHFAGQCQGSNLVGALTLHGVTRPVVMAIERNGSHVNAIGTVQRRDFGIRGLPGLVGQRVRLRFDAMLPAEPAAP